MRAAADRVAYATYRALGRLLRAGTYADVRGGTVAEPDGSHDVPEVHKERRFYAPLLVWLGGPLVRLLDTGVRVLPQREWENRERELYARLHGAAIRSAGSRTLRLPRLPGETLAALLEQAALDDAVRTRAIRLAVSALKDLHRHGFTHGDAMAENVLVDVAADAAHWFDFETVHDPGRPLEWRRADDMRALLSTCLLRTRDRDLAATLRLMLDSYADDRITRLVAAQFSARPHRTLIFHLGQAPLSHGAYRNIRRLLQELTGS